MNLSIKVIPNAPRNQIDGWQEKVLKVRIATVPEKGKANEELISFLAEVLGIAKSRIRLVLGGTSRIKRVDIEGLSTDEIEQRINAFLSRKKR